jgi:hypothetical protein
MFLVPFLDSPRSDPLLDVLFKLETLPELNNFAQFTLHHLLKQFLRFFSVLQSHRSVLHLLTQQLLNPAVLHSIPLQVTLQLLEHLFHPLVKL